MADGTKIEWTDATWNPITGCAVVSPGCTNCYAMKLAGTRLRHIPSRAGLTRDTKAGPVWTGEIRFNSEWLDQPLRWRRPRMIFVCAHGDLFAEGVTDEMLDQVYAMMALAPQHTFQVLTKRPERMRDYCRRTDETGCHPALVQAALLALTGRWNTPPLDLRAWPLANVWAGVSAEDQRRADERIPALLDTPAAVRWVSAEPLLGPIDLFEPDGEGPLANGEPSLEQIDGPNGMHFVRYGAPRLDWIVVGGESGHGARPMHPDWARAIRDQCASAGVPFLFKQWGEWAPICAIDTDAMVEQLYHPVQARHRPEGPRRCKVAQCIIHRDGLRFDLDEWSRTRRDVGLSPHAAGSGHMLTMAMGKKAAGRLLDGVQHDGYPPADEILF